MFENKHFDEFDESLTDYKKRPSRRPPAYYDDMEDDNDALMSSLEKYRPSNYEIGRPKEDDDINNIRDYYSNMMTRQRAINRFVPRHQLSRSEIDPNEADADEQATNEYVRQTSYETQYVDQDPYFEGKLLHGCFVSNSFFFENAPETKLLDILTNKYDFFMAKSWNF